MKGMLFYFIFYMSLNYCYYIHCELIDPRSSFKTFNYSNYKQIDILFNKINKKRLNMEINLKNNFDQKYFQDMIIELENDTNKKYANNDLFKYNFFDQIQITKINSTTFEYTKFKYNISNQIIEKKNYSIDKLNFWYKNYVEIFNKDIKIKLIQKIPNYKIKYEITWVYITIHFKKNKKKMD